MNRRGLLAALLMTCGLASAEPATTTPAGLRVDGDVPTALTLAAADLAALPHQSMKVKDHDGSTATYAGVPVRDLLLKAGIPLGQHRLRGPLLATAVVVTSADGYLPLRRRLLYPTELRVRGRPSVYRPADGRSSRGVGGACPVGGQAPVRKLHTSPSRMT